MQRMARRVSQDDGTCEYGSQGEAGVESQKCYRTGEPYSMLKKPVWQSSPGLLE